MKVSDELSEIIDDCISKQASDLFLQPKTHEYQVLYRTINGISLIKKIDFETATQMMTFIKYRADMAISEKRRPLSGALRWKYKDPVGEVNLRISTVGDFLDRPTMVIRFIYNQINQKSVLDEEALNEIIDATKLRGLLVFSGPMGSGKTTLIYDIARKISHNHLVMTIEDPVEIKEERFLQLQVNEKSGMAYKDLLKSGLRNRPDIFIVGEIRDEQTAEIAVQAALSGHLVLTTIHAKSANGVFERLRELEIKNEYLNEALTASIYQRMLPTKENDIRIITDLKSFHPNLQSSKRSWNQKLKECRDAGQITNSVYEEFKYG